MDLASLGLVPLDEPSIDFTSLGLKPLDGPAPPVGSGAAPRDQFLDPPEMPEAPLDWERIKARRIDELVNGPAQIDLAPFQAAYENEADPQLKRQALVDLQVAQRRNKTRAARIAAERAEQQALGLTPEQYYQKQIYDFTQDFDEALPVETSINRIGNAGPLRGLTSGLTALASVPIEMGLRAVPNFLPGGEAASQLAEQLSRTRADEESYNQYADTQQGAPNKYARQVVEMFVKYVPTAAIARPVGGAIGRAAPLAGRAAPAVAKAGETVSKHGLLGFIFGEAQSSAYTEGAESGLEGPGLDAYANTMGAVNAAWTLVGGKVAGKLGANTIEEPGGGVPATGFKDFFKKYAIGAGVETTVEEWPTYISESLARYVAKISDKPIPDTWRQDLFDIAVISTLAQAAGSLSSIEGEQARQFVENPNPDTAAAAGVTPAMAPTQEDLERIARKTRREIATREPRQLHINVESRRKSPAPETAPPPTQTPPQPAPQPVAPPDVPLPTEPSLRAAEDSGVAAVAPEAIVPPKPDQLMGKPATFVSERVDDDNIVHELYEGEGGTAFVRILDADSGHLVGLAQHPSLEAAQREYDGLPPKKRLGKKRQTQPIGPTKPPEAEPTNTIAGKMTLREFEDKGYQPDEVTQADWVNMQRAFRRSIGQSEESGTQYAPFADYEEYHKQAVREAIARGEKVDDRVLADYPDLAPRPPITRPLVPQTPDPQEAPAPGEVVQPVGDDAPLRTGPPKTLGKKRPALTAQDFRQQLDSIATNKEEADAIYKLVEARAEAAGETLDQYVGKRIAGVEKTPQRESVYLQQRAAGTLKDTFAQPAYHGSPYPRWYVKSRKLVAEKMGGKATGEQVLAMLRKNGAKEEELEWMGLTELLAPGSQVTKQQVLDAIDNGGVQVEEVVKGTPPSEALDAWNAGVAEQERLGADYQDAFNTLRESLVDAGLIEPTMPLDSNRFLLRPGTELYGRAVATGLKPQLDRYNQSLAAWADFELPESPYAGAEEGKFSSYTLPGGENYRELLLTLPHQGDSASYRSSHFDEPNVLAHVRFNERTDADGKKVLFIEEIQSDWHQEGRKKGYGRKKVGSDPLMGLINEGDSTIRTGVPDAPFKQSWPMLAMKRAIQWAAENGFDRIAWTTGEQQAERYDLSKQVEAVSWVKYTKGETALSITSIDGDSLNGRLAAQFGFPQQDSTGGPVFVPDEQLEDVVGKELAKKILEGGPDGVLQGDGLKVGGEGMKGFYDKILPSETQKFIKKFGAKVGRVDLGDGMLSEGDFTYRYEGPTPTLDQLKTFLKEADRSDGNVYKNPITGATEAYAINRVSVSNTTRSLIKHLEGGGDISDWFTRHGTPELAELMGGRLARLENKQQRVQHGFDITPPMREAALREGQPLFQRDGDRGPSGEIQFLKDGRAIIRAFEESQNLSTLAHELGHLFRRDLDGDMLRTAAEWAGAKEGQKWPRAAEEKFARGFERYLRDGEAPTPALKTVFEKFKQWLSSLYKALKGSPLDVDVTPQMREVYDSLFAPPKKRLGKKADVEVVAEPPTVGSIWSNDKESRTVLTVDNEGGLTYRIKGGTNDGKTAYASSDGWQRAIDKGLRESAPPIIQTADQLPDWVTEGVDQSALPPLEAAEKAALSKHKRRLRKKIDPEQFAELEALHPRDQLVIADEADRRADVESQYWRDVAEEYDTLFTGRQSFVSFVTKSGQRRVRRDSPAGRLSAKARLAEMRGSDPAALQGFDELVQSLRYGMYPTLAAHAEAVGDGDLEAGLFEIVRGGRKAIEAQITDPEAHLSEVLEEFYERLERSPEETGGEEGGGTFEDGPADEQGGQADDGLSAGEGAGRSEAEADDFQLSREGSRDTSPIVEPFEPERIPPSTRGSERQGFLTTEMEPGSLPGQQGLFEGAQGSDRGPMLQPLSSPVAVTPKSQRQIIVDLAKGLGTPIRFGRLLSRKFGGHFLPIQNLIGSKRANDLPVISHEAGHRLDSLFKLSDNKSIAAELEMLGDPATPGSRSSWTKSKSKTYKRGEGVAEFVRYWLTEPAEAQKLAPNTFLAFEQILDANRDLAHVLRQAQEDIRVWRTSEPQARLRSHISRGENPLKTRYSLDQVTRDLVDDLHYVKLAVEDALKGQPNLAPSKNPYLLARNLRGSYGMADTFIRSGTVDFNTKEVSLGESLEDALKPVAGRMRDFGDWIVAKRAQELHKQGRETGLIPADVDAVVALYDKDAAFQQAFANVKRWNDAVLQYAVDAGLVTNETARKMRTMNKDYVPFHRLFEVGADEATSQESNRTGSGLNPGKPGSLKRLKGSTRNIVDPIETMIKNAYAIITAAEKSAINNAVADMARLPNMGKWVEEVAAPSEAVKVPLDRIRDQLEAAGADLAGVDDDLLMTFFVKSTSPVFGENTIRVVRPNGQTKFYRLNRYLHDTFLALDVDDAGKLIRILSAPAQVLRAGVVLEPGFNLANVFRDTFGAAVVGKYGALPFETTIRGLAALVNKPQLVAEWAASGGRSAVEANYFDRKKMQQFLAEKISKELTPAERALVRIRSPLTLLRTIATIGEEATRIGEYEKAYKALVKGGMPAGEARRLAAFEARDRQDFAKGGARTKWLRHISAFWNAQLQANVKLAESFKKRPARTILTGLAFVTLPKLLEQALNWDDDDYWNRPQWERDLFWMIPIGKDDSGHTEFLRLPVPFEIGVIFATVPGRFLQWARENDPESVKGLPTMLLKNTVPNPAPQTTQLIYETMMTGEQGWSYFRGRPIVPDRLADYPPDMRWDEHSSTLAKTIGAALKIAPLKIDYAIESTTGGLGKIFAGRKTPADRFFTTPLAISSQAIQDFYEIRKQLTQQRKAQQATGESEGLGPVMYSRFERDAAAMSKLRDQALQADDAEAARMQDEAYQIAKAAVEQYRRDPQDPKAAVEYAKRFATDAILGHGYPAAAPDRKTGESTAAYNARVKEYQSDVLPQRLEQWRQDRATAAAWLRRHKDNPAVQEAVKSLAPQLKKLQTAAPQAKGLGSMKNYRQRRLAWQEKYSQGRKLFDELTK